MRNKLLVGIIIFSLTSCTQWTVLVLNKTNNVITLTSTSLNSKKVAPDSIVRVQRNNITRKFYVKARNKDYEGIFIDGRRGIYGSNCEIEYLGMTFQLSEKPIKGISLWWDLSIPVKIVFTPEKYLEKK